MGSVGASNNNQEVGSLREPGDLWLGTWLKQTLSKLAPRDLPPRFESSGSLFK